MKQWRLEPPLFFETSRECRGEYRIFIYKLKVGLSNRSTGFLVEFRAAIRESIIDILLNFDEFRKIPAELSEIWSKQLQKSATSREFNEIPLRF